MSAQLKDALDCDSPLNLDQAAVGGNFQVEAIEGDGAACRQLREIGFCEEMQIRKIADGRNLVCAVCGARLAVSRDLAKNVRVTPIG